MPMEIDRRQLKQQAREAMFQAKPSFWLVTLVYILMTTGLMNLADFAPSGLMATFLSVALTFYAWVVAFGYRLWAIWTCRRLEPGLNSLMEGFSVAGRVILLELSIFVRTVGWAVLLSIPGTLILLPVSSAPGGLVISGVVVLGLVACISVILLRYSLSYYVLADYPNYGPGVALAHSIRLTNGWRWELVKLYLSFAGWYILSIGLSVVGMGVGVVLTGGVSSLAGLPMEEMMVVLNQLLDAPIVPLVANALSLPVMLYLTPYMETSLAQFYEARIHLGDNMADPLGGMPPVVNE